MDKPQLTIITVVYNSSSLLEKTINSIANLKCKNIEYIIIDGNSNDDINLLIERNTLSIDLFVSESDDGIYDAMNKGLKLASGKYIWFLNAGDTIASKSALLMLLKNLKLNKNFIYSDVLLKNDKGYIKLCRSPESLNMSNMTKGMFVCHQSFIVKRELAPLYDLRYKYIADQKWVIECINHNRDSFVKLKLPLSIYLLGGVSDENSAKCLVEKVQLIKSEYQYYFFKNLFYYLSQYIKIKLKYFLNLLC